jgi:biotin synthase
MLVRASAGTLARLGLIEFKTLEEPSTAYLLQYSEKGCNARCGFCLQSRSSRREPREWLGRVSWPAVGLGELKNSWRRVFKRICFQTVLKPGFHSEALKILGEIREVDPETPSSLAITPVPEHVLEASRRLGVDAVGVGLDASTPGLFEKWGKPYSWSVYWRFIEKAVRAYGAGNVYVHLIAGLGESLREIVETMLRAHGAGCRIALFAYVDPRGSSKAGLKHYRLAQLARFLIENGLNPEQYIDLDKEWVKRDIPLSNLLEAFYTSGCPGCNRPFYNESPRGPLYNIPSARAMASYLERLKEELRSIGVEA